VVVVRGTVVVVVGSGAVVVEIVGIGVTSGLLTVSCTTPTVAVPPHAPASKATAGTSVRSRQRPRLGPPASVSRLVPTACLPAIRSNPGSCSRRR
jgi:hypothetical protein